MSAQQSKVFTTQLTSDSLVITESMAVKQISIFNGSAVTGTVTGDNSLGSTASSPIDIEESVSFTLKAVDASVIVGVTITAPAGCTLKIVAQ